MRRRDVLYGGTGLAVLVVLVGCGLCLRGAGWAGRTLPAGLTARQIVAGARDEVIRGVQYDPAYVRISYPGGDVPPDRGVCADVVVRGLRRAGYDLQALIHRDMESHFDLYPHRYGLTAPDSSIDHRRTPNQIAFLRRHGLELPRSVVGSAAQTWQPGDLVYCEFPHVGGHCGVISDRLGPSGLPLVIHNAGPTPREEDCLLGWNITGHFRYPAGV